MRLTDKLQRPLRDLRISVTDRCNFRCVYCMPTEAFDRDYQFLGRDKLLTFEETARLAGIFAFLGVEKVRITGGEPLLRRELEILVVLVEFLCETNEVEPGRIFRPKGESTGSKLGAFNVRGAHLVRDDFIERAIEGERLDAGGRSRVAVRVANLLPYTVLKIFAFQDRHENKDAYDLVFTLLNYTGDP